MSSPSGQNRGGTPIGVRALLGARPCWQHGRLDWRLSAFHILSLFRGAAKRTKRTGKSRHHPFFSFTRRFFASHRGGNYETRRADAARERGRSSVHMPARRVSSTRNALQNSRRKRTVPPLVPRLGFDLALILVPGLPRVWGLWGSGVVFPLGRDGWTLARPSASASF
jgi:hypothetical protein